MKRIGADPARGPRLLFSSPPCAPVAARGGGRPLPAPAQVSPHGRKSDKLVTIARTRARKLTETNGQEGRRRPRADRFVGEEAGQRAVGRRPSCERLRERSRRLASRWPPSLWHNYGRIDVSNGHTKKSHKSPCVRHKAAASQDRLPWYADHAGTPSAFVLFSY